MIKKYIRVPSKKIKKVFIVKRNKDYLTLRYQNAKNSIKLKNPILLTEDFARIAGMMPDGSLIKDLMRIYFHQKKEPKKLKQFAYLIKKLFSPESVVLYKENETDKQVYINSQTLARFFYHILQIPKSDEQMRVPKWVFNSLVSVKQAYLKEAFAMEGTILKSLYEIRFITKDKKFAHDIKILLSTLSIQSHITERMAGTPIGLQYRVSIYRKENFIEFKDIGFDTKLHKKRFKRLLRNYKIANL